MESNETKQSEQGQVSALGESPKDENQVEIALAAKYEVQPRMVRLLDELIERKLAPLEQAGSQEQAAGENRPKTGVPALDHYLDKLSLEAKVAVCGTMELMVIANETGDKIREYLRNEVAIFEDPEEGEIQSCMDSKAWSECSWYLGFVKGAEVGQRGA